MRAQWSCVSPERYAGHPLSHEDPDPDFPSPAASNPSRIILRHPMKLSDARRKVICAIDTSNLNEAISTVARLQTYSAAFKIGHALTLPHGLSVIARLRDAGAERIFLDLKFHDIPNVIGLAIREAARHGAWMTTLHLSGGPAMLTAAVEEARSVDVERAPLLVGVSVLTSLSEATLRGDLGVGRCLEAHVVALSKMGVDCGLDGIVCSPHEAALVRPEIGDAVIVTPGIRPRERVDDDQTRVADAKQAMKAGADYMVIGRPLTAAENPEEALVKLGFEFD